jgi:hypothetical protein
MTRDLTFSFFLFFSSFSFFPNACLPVKGREAKCLNVLAEFELIAPEGLNSDQSYTLVTQREPDQQVK